MIEPYIYLDQFYFVKILGAKVLKKLFRIILNTFYLSQSKIDRRGLSKKK